MMLIFLFCLLTVSASASVKLQGPLANGAVLQQGIDAPVWGAANDGEKVTVK